MNIKYPAMLPHLKHNMTKVYTSSIQELYDIIEIITPLCNGEKCNVSFEHTNPNKKRIFTDDELTSMYSSFIQKKGVNKLITGIKEHFLDTYEVYIIHKMCDDNVEGRNKFKKYLSQYYDFLLSFSIEPYVITEKQTLENNNEIVSICMELYESQRDTITTGKIEQIREMVHEIIRLHPNQKLEELCEKIVLLFDIDESFKKKIFPLIVNKNY